VFYHSFAATYDAGLFWQSNLLLFAVNLGFLAVTSLLLPRLWQEGDAGGPSRRARTARTRTPDDHAAVRRRRARWLAANPLQWLVLRDEYERPWLWTVVILASAGSVGVWLLRPGDWDVALGIFIGFQVVHFAVKCWVASAATRTLSEARQTGALELILSTPLPARQIVRGLRLALRHMFLAPVLVLLFTEVGLTAVQLAVHVGTGGAVERVLLSLLALVTSLAVFIVDLLAVANLGMWLGLTQRSAAAALFRAILYVLVLPLPLLPCGCVGPWLWLSKSVVILTWAQTNLNQNFRSIISGYHEPPPVR
jgi:hypothetical protein